MDRAAAGEEIIIAKAGKPVTRLVGMESQVSARKPGSLKGLIRVGEDFDAPLPSDIGQAFGTE